eukprot:TRINITY_DN386_c0_g2_i4.p1 TRINITY_DN386_c0_g2~~TRINITY_DN386_c0_g2_i4.p1  ORF type:complete len:237 (-),score=55.12 TRINITY_DN386_c0_g2_i4:148-858(-)
MNSINVLELGVGSGCVLTSIIKTLRDSLCQRHSASSSSSPSSSTSSPSIPTSHPMKTHRVFGVGTDLSKAALRIAKLNAERMGLSVCCAVEQNDTHSSSSPLEKDIELLQGSWFEALKRSPSYQSYQQHFFDVVISNPPYIPTNDLSTLMPSVYKYEPTLALDGGKDGYDAYRRIATSLSPRLEEVLKHGGRAIFEVGYQQAETVKSILHQHTDLRWQCSKFDVEGIERCLVFSKA